MGTLLHGRGAKLDGCFDAINVDEPALVADIHRNYILAGSDIIETNSFGANRYKLSDYGRTEEVGALNAAAATIARRVIESSFKPVLLAGSIGPLGARLAPLGRVSLAEARASFAEQIEALVNPGAGVAGVDLLIIETMSDLKEVEAAVQAARSVSTDIPIITFITFTRDDRTMLGDTAADVAAALQQLDVDVIGINCSSGPAQILRLAAAMRQIVPDKPLAVSPNAGWPEQTEGGRVHYPATPDYFADYARAFVDMGIAVLGGCCGTTAAHIAAMRQALDTPGRTTRPKPRVQLRPQREAVTITADQPTRLAQALANGEFVKDGGDEATTRDCPTTGRSGR